MGNAQLVAVGFGVAFAATGIGAPVGFLIGSIVGNMLFPPKPITSQGPRLGDLQVTSSAYGAPRAIGFGTVRQGGNVIWSIPIIEQKNTRKVSGGKGSMSGAPDQKQTTYSYFGTFAVAFGEGPADDVLRIWADSKLIFDKTSLSTSTRKAGLVFRFYTGSESQTADPAIVADKGLANTPAFRGTCYLVFDNLPLKDFGNRLPNITAEIAYTATELRTSEVSTDGGFAFTDWLAGMFAADWERGFFYTVDIQSSTAGNTAIRKFRLSDLTEVAQANDTEALASGTLTLFHNRVMAVAPNGNIVLTVDATPVGGNADPVAMLDPNTLSEIARVGKAGTSVLIDTGTGVPVGVDVTPNIQLGSATSLAFISMYGYQGREDYALMATQFDSAAVLKVTQSTISHIWNSDSFTGFQAIPDGKIRCVTGGKIGEGNGTGYILATNFTFPTSNNLSVYQVEVKAGASFGPLSGFQFFTGVELSKVLDLSPGTLFPGATQITGNTGAMFYDQTDDTVIFFAEISSPTAEGRWFKYNPNTGVQVWRSEPVAATVHPNDSRIGEGSRLQDGTLGYSVNTKACLLDTVTGELIINGDGGDFSNAMGLFAHGHYDSRSETFVGPSVSSASSAITRHFYRRKTANALSVGTIVKNLSNRVGLTDADLDTTSIDATTTPGYLIGRQTSARAAIQPLSAVYYFDGVESDDKLKFILRGGASIRTINESEFAPLGKNGQTIKINRAQEVELPERYTLMYLDKDKDYQQNAHNAKRVKNPLPAMRSDNELGIDYPGALASDFAKQAAEKGLYTAWTERNNYEVKIPWTHLDLDPSDVITLNLNNGTRLRARIAEADFGADYQIALTGIGENDNQFVSSVLADSGSGVPVQTVQASTFVFMKLLDVPLLRDADEIPSRAANPIYALMGASQPGTFLAGTAYKSSDGGVTFTEVQSFVSEMSWGTTVNALGDPAPGTVFMTDETNTLTVKMVTGEEDLVSVTKLEMLNGANAAALIKTNGEIEIIQYQNVTDNGDGTFTLDTLLRGRRGTDTMAHTHTAFENFIVLAPNDIEKIVLSLAELDASRTYKAVGAGQLFEDGETQALTSNHRALMPYAVVHQAAAPGASNSIDFSWVRRTRLGGDLQNGFGTIPLNEDTEEYEIDIKDGPGGTIVRTVTGLTTPAYNYTSANQTTDGFTPPLSSITVTIYQISAQVGRGFAQEVTLNVE